MYMWHLDQFGEDLTKQRAMRAHVQAQGYGEPLATVIEDMKEDTEEDSMGSDYYIPRGYTHEPVNQEDFDS
ncbi:hypothetical protein FNV43_RR02643 [Rhamnella rubrinervis]|uniref:Uncharacterized protein n=1 Tax=Rhamnella rubrinervis TaxID=2594499 RepID=A0A8K0HRV0_9ROSA|nr:hypothetical protein FNV43_RR02643 [Rhamnella rubrinervis]